MSARDGATGLLARTRPALRAAPRYLSATLAAFGGDEQAQLWALAVLIRAAAGLAVILFYKTIDAVQALVLEGALRTPIPEFVLIPAPARRPGR